MKKKVKVLLPIITILISTVLFINRVDAVVMWMQCTDKPDGEMYHNNDIDKDSDWIGSGDKDYKKYNTIALINNINNDVRHLIYVGNDFYKGVQGPTYALYTNDNGKVSTQICWYNSEFYDADPKSGGPLSECDKEEDFISVADLHNGMCPGAMYQTTGYNTSGNVKGDFAVLVGEKKPALSESLTESSLVIYGFIKKENGKYVDMMIEGYDAATGKYGYATTWKDWDSFEANLNIPKDEEGGGLVSGKLLEETAYDVEFINWTSITQVRRIVKFGKDYFKLLDDDVRPWLVGAVEDQKFRLASRDTIFYSDDKNDKFYNWVSKWYESNSEELSEQIGAMKDLKSEKFQKTYNVSKEISKTFNEGKKYNFDENYSASQMVLDLNEAFEKLDIILSKDNLYEIYDNNCNLADDKTNDPQASILTQFNCEMFKTPLIANLKHNTNPDVLDANLLSVLNKTVDKYTKSDISIASLQDEAKDYARLFTIAIRYIKKNEILTGEAETLISTLEENYIKMLGEVGIEAPIMDCGDLIGEDLREKIRSYLNIVKIAVPIILIAFGIIDFTKAMFAGDEEKMRKAQRDFIMRLGIAILFFFVPTIVDLLLKLANKVWNFIEPGSCGIFND